MSTVDWLALPLLGFDLESTGVNPHMDRIVQAAVVRHRPSQAPETFTWLADPGIEIPDEAAAVHGITTERARAEGMDPGVMLFELSGHLGLAMGRQIPIVIANAPYDMTMVEAENRRHGVDTLSSRVAPLPLGPVIDPMVLDKHIDPYRKSCYKAGGCDPETKHHECGGCQGSREYACGGCGVTDRTLSSLCKHYGVQLDDAHDAGADALAAVQLVLRLVQVFPGAFRRLTPGGLHQAQVGWRREQMDSLRRWFDRNGIEHDGCDPSWPLLPTPVTAAEVQGALL